MFALVYSSEAVTVFNDGELLGLCSSSSVNNLKIDVTGYLYFRHGNFFQYLEGEKKTVMELFNRVQVDRRHKIKKVIYDETITERRFPDWSMRYLLLDGVQYEDIIQSRMDLLEFVSVNEEAKSKVWEGVNKLSNLRSVLE